MSWLSLFCLIFISVYADDQLEEIQVKAEKELKVFSFTSSSETSAAEIEKETLPLLNNQLKTVAGLNTVQLGGPGSQTSYFMRGTNPQHVIFTLDGMKLNDPSASARSYDGAFFTTPFIQEMTIYKGPQAVLYGSDAFGGLVDMRSRKGENAPETRLNVMGGSFGTAQASLAHDWKNKKNQGTITWTEFRTDGISTLNKKRWGSTERDASRMTQATSSSQHHWAPKFETDFLVSYLVGKVEYDGYNSLFQPGDTNDHSRQDQYILQQKTNYEIDKKSSISLRNGLNRYQRFAHDSRPGTFNGNLIQNEVLYRKKFNELSLLVGGANEYESYDDISENESIQVNSAFLQTAFQIERWKIQAGGRYDNHSKFNNFLTGSAGLAYEYESNQYSLQYSQGYKAPSLYQLYGYNTWGVQGNPDLRPESNHALEGKWKKTTQNLDTELSVYENRLSNLIVSPGMTKHFNAGRLVVQGIDANITWKEKYFKVRPGFNHQKFKDYAIENVLVRKPQNSANIQLDFTPTESNEFSVLYRWVASRRDVSDGGGLVKTNSFEVMDLSYRFVQDKFDFTVQMKNLLNREYEEAYGYSTLPRSYFVGIGCRFH